MTKHSHIPSECEVVSCQVQATCRYLNFLTAFSNLCEIFCSTEGFQQQQEFTNEIESMEVDELNKCLAKFSFPWGKPKAAIIRKPACCRSEPPSTDILKPQNLSKICLFFILFSRIIFNVIIPKQLDAPQATWISANSHLGFVSVTIRRRYSRRLQRLKC